LSLKSERRGGVRYATDTSVSRSDGLTAGFSWHFGTLNVYRVDTKSAAKFSRGKDLASGTLLRGPVIINLGLEINVQILPSLEKTE